MSQVLRFFPRQTLVGPYPTYYSDIYDVSAFSDLVAELQVFGIAGTVTASVETSGVPFFSPDANWTQIGTTIAIGAGGSVVIAITPGTALRYVRAKIDVAGANSMATVSVECVARESS